MPGGVSLGGAYFTLDATAAPLIQAMSQAEQASQKSVQAIAQSLGKSEKDVQRLAQSWIAAENQRANASAASALKIIKAHNDAADAAAKQSAKLGLSLSAAIESFTGVGLAAGGMVAAFEIASKGAEKLAESMKVTVEATLAADQAQRTLNATYGSAAPIFKKFADDQAAAFNRTNTEVEKSVAGMAVLQKQYGLTSDEIEKLTKVGLNLGATFGSQEEAIRSVQAAIRGEPEALEKYGIALQQNAIQNNDLLTESEKKHFASLDAVTQARIRYQIILQQSAQFEDAAAVRAASLQGGFDKLERSTNNLEVALGKIFVPTLSKTAGLLGELTDRVAATVDAMSKLPSAQSPAEKTLDAVGLAALRASGPVGQIVAGLIQINRDFGPASTPTSDTGVQFGPSPGDVTAATAKQRAAAEERRADAQRVRVEEAKDGVAAAEAIHRREVKDLDDRKQLLEGERAAKLRTVEAEKDAALKGIEAESRAAKEASDAKIRGLRVEEEAAKRAAQATHEGVVRGLQAEQQAVEDATAEQIRQQEITRDHAKQASEDERDAAIKDLEAQTRARDDARVLEDRALDDAAQAQQRRIADAHTQATRALEDESREIDKHKDKRLREIEDESKAAQKAHDAATRRLEEQSRAEDRKHQKILQNIADESKRQLDAIDAQIKALDDAQKQEDNASKVSDLQKKVADARTALTAATGTGTPEQITGARGDLTAATRIGDPTAIKNAEDRLRALAGAGADEIKKAQDDLNKTLADLQAEQTKEVRDAQKDQLQIQKDGITAQAEAAKRAEDARDQQRKDRLQKDKQASDDTLKKAQDAASRQKQLVDDQAKHDHEAIDARKRDEQDAHDNAVQAARDVAEQAKRAVADRRRVEDEAAQDKRKQIADTYTEEQRQIKATYDDEDTGVIPALHRALTAEQERFKQRKQDADDAYADEQRNIQDTYNDPVKGLIPLAEQAAAAVTQGFQDQAKATTEAAAQQTKDINDVYSNPVTHGGLLDLIEQARKDTEDKLQNQRDYWKDWAEDLGGENGQIAKVINKFDDLIKKITDVGGTVKVGTNVTEPSFRGDASDGGGPGPGVGAGSDTVPDPYQVQFPFGARYSDPFNSSIPIHRGVDVTVKGAANGGKGSPVSAFEDGEVVYNAYDPNGGNGVIIKGTDGLYHRYFHFDSTSVGVGDKVHRGDQIGILGETGTEGSPHLHYEVSHSSGGDPISDLIDPVPYMNKGGAAAKAGGRTFEFDLFGRHFTVTLPGGAAGSALIQAIERLGEGIGGREFGRAAASIALSEGADGDLSHAGSGGAWGPFQFDPGGELPGYADYLHKSVDEAGNYAGTHPLNAAAYALSGDGDGFSGRGYLGRAIRSGLANELKGADLAEYASELGQRPAGDLWKRAGDASRQLWGYRYGGWISPNSVISDANGPYARTEGLAERVLSPEQSAAWAGGSSAGGGTRIFNVNGVGVDEFARRLKAAEHREDLLTGVRR